MMRASHENRLEAYIKRACLGKKLNKRAKICKFLGNKLVLGNCSQHLSESGRAYRLFLRVKYSKALAVIA